MACVQAVPTTGVLSMSLCEATSPVRVEDIRIASPYEHGGYTYKHVLMCNIPYGILPKHPDFYAAAVVWKKHDAEKEVAAYRMLELVAPELAVPCWLVGDDRVVMRKVRGITWEQHQRRGGLSSSKLEYQKGQMRAFDVLISNSDRHEGNFMVVKGRGIKAIDHGAGLCYYSPVSDYDFSEQESDVKQGMQDCVNAVAQHADAITELMAPFDYRWNITVREWCQQMQENLNK